MIFTAKNTILLFAVLFVLSLIVISQTKSNKITSIYSKEGFQNTTRFEEGFQNTTRFEEGFQNTRRFEEGFQNTRRFEEGFQNENADDKNNRKAGVLYSGDIIDIADTNDDKSKFLSRQDYNSEVVFASPTETGVTTNLTKLRIISINHNDKSIQYPIKFGDTVVIAHNAYIENQNAVRYVKYGEKLQSHQQGEMFRNYKVVNPENKDDTSLVKYDTPILLRRADSTDTAFLTLEKENTVTTKNPFDKASKMFLRLRRVYEPYEKNLCICLNEILYP